MIDLLIKRLSSAFNLTYDLYESLDEQNLSRHLGNLPSNTIGQQAWCIIGARESYFLAIQLGEWQGFSCSLRDSKIKKSVLEKLDTTRRNVISFLNENKNQHINHDFIFDMLEHEVRHHGQLIRYIYGNKLNFPDSWKDFIT